MYIDSVILIISKNSRRFKELVCLFSVETNKEYKLYSLLKHGVRLKYGHQWILVTS